MKTLMIVALSALTLSQTAMAKDRRPAVDVKKGDTQVVVTLTGPVAEKLMDALDGKAEFEFGIIQRWIRKTERVECERAVLGDVPPHISEPRFTCRITEELR